MSDSTYLRAAIALVATIALATIGLSTLPSPEAPETAETSRASTPQEFAPWAPQVAPGAEMARVRIRSNPVGRIFIDGKDKQQDTPYTFDVPPGKHKVQVTYKGGKRSRARSITVREGSLATLVFNANQKDSRVIEVKTDTPPPVDEAPPKKSKRVTLKPARLVIIANFEKTDITVNDKPYPEYVPLGEEPGMVLPAGGPYRVKVTYDGKTKLHILGLEPYEKRVMIVEIPGFKGGGASAPIAPSAKRDGPPKPKPKKQDEVSEDETGGRVTVYGKPRGSIMVDGADQGKQTPNTVDVEQGRHEIQVKYEDGEISEKKIVRVRKGSRIKLFFRQRKKK